MTSDVHVAGPLPQAAPDDEHHAGPLKKGTRAARPPRQKRTWSEDRWRRRKRRHVFEEVLGWILVPIIVVAVIWGVRGGLAAFGTSPTALVTGIKQAISGKS